VTAPALFARWHDLRPRINAIGLLANLACGKGNPNLGDKSLNSRVLLLAKRRR
jgi:hypothetical protein